MSRYNVFIKKLSINGIGLYVLPREVAMMPDATFIGELSAENHYEAVAAAWLRLLGKF
jgi:hypothetical protein